LAEKGSIVRNVVSKGPRRAAALIVASAAVMLAAACGGGSSNSNSSGTTTGGGNGGGANQALTAYVNCMKQNGVTLTLPSFAPRTGASRGAGGYGNGGARPSGQPRPSGSFGGGNRGGFPGGQAGFFQKPAGVDDATWQKAQSACAKVLPSRGTGGFGRGDGANSAYRNCLQQHGVTMTNGTEPDTANPTVRKAQQTCKVLRPTASPTPTS
jgi:hypothetical protein